MSNEVLYKVHFVNNGEVYQVYARSVSQSSMYAFVEIEELIFGEKSQLVVDPSEERLKSEFDSVKKSFIPVHSIVRIDQVTSQGTAKITDLNSSVQTGSSTSNITSFPGVIPPKK